jgi:hypothetical protein
VPQVGRAATRRYARVGTLMEMETISLPRRAASPPTCDAVGPGTFERQSREHRDATALKRTLQSDGKLTNQGS